MTSDTAWLLYMRAIKVAGAGSPQAWHGQRRYAEAVHLEGRHPDPSSQRRLCPMCEGTEEP